jgi:hypothetical protein
LVTTDEVPLPTLLVEVVAADRLRVHGRAVVAQPVQADPTEESDNGCRNDTVKPGRYSVTDDMVRVGVNYRFGNAEFAKY